MSSGAWRSDARLLASPRLLLLDEPLGSLDAGRKQEILPYLDRLIAEHRLPMLYVTHDPLELDGRATEVITLAEGRARQATGKQT